MEASVKLHLHRGLLLSALLAVGLLAACGGGNADVETAMAYLNALNEGDVGAALAHVCEAHADEVREGLTSTTDTERRTFSYTNIQCSASGSDEVNCTYTVVQDAGTSDNAAQGTERVETVTLRMEDGKVCEATIDNE